MIETKSPVLTQLAIWSESEPADHKKIVQAMLVAACTRRGMPIREQYVKKCSLYPHIYEFIAHKHKARVMFFYHEDDVIICANTFWKTNAKSQQDAAFGEAEAFRQLCLEFPPEIEE